MLLYDHTGLAIYDEIVQLPEYYLVPAETAIFENQGKEIIDAALAGAENGVAFLELGCGSMEKTKHLLKHLADHPLGPKCTYYAVDLDPSTLDAVVASAQAAFPTLHFVGLNGSYDDALAFLNRGGLDPHPHVDRKKCVFWFGSSIGNFDREAATSFVTTWSAALNPNDLFAIAIDRRNEKQKIELAYNDPAGVTARFCLNGLVHANRLLSSLHPLPESEYYFDPKDWTYFSRYDEQKGRHEAYFRCTKPDGLLIPLPESESLAPEDPIRTHSSDDFAGGLQIAENELVHIEFSYKYSPDESSALAAEAGLRTDRIFTSPNNEYDLHLFHKPTLLFPSSSGTSPPTKKEWEALWSAWELITEQMIPRERILEKPISLRHPFVFYAGHIPAFADIIVDKALQWGLLEPRGYAEVFERGIDPDMDGGVEPRPTERIE